MPPLFTPRFVAMFAFSFSVFFSMFQLFPVAPYRISALGGSPAESGLFLGLLTFASAISAPFTGAFCDRIGHRRALVGAASAITVLALAYAVIDSTTALFAVVVLHGVIWSALMTASAAYTTATIPPARRGEGLGYWGLASMLAIGVAPSIGFWVYGAGWTTLCLEIAVLNAALSVGAWLLPADAVSAPAGGAILAAGGRRHAIEWPVLILAVSVALVAFGYGGLTSFSGLFADSLGVSPPGIFLAAMACSVVAVRLAVGRRLDAWGPDRVLRTCLVVPAFGLALEALSVGRMSTVAAGVVFGAGFSLMFPAFAAFVIGHVPPPRRAAAFGAMLAAFDTGIGAGLAITGWTVGRGGYRVAFGAAAVVAALALPYFHLLRGRLHFGDAGH